MGINWDFLNVLIRTINIPIHKHSFSNGFFFQLPYHNFFWIISLGALGTPPKPFQVSSSLRDFLKHLFDAAAIP